MSSLFLTDQLSLSNIESFYNSLRMIEASYNEMSTVNVYYFSKKVFLSIFPWNLDSGYTKAYNIVCRQI